MFLEHATGFEQPPSRLLCRTILDGILHQLEEHLKQRAVRCCPTISSLLVVIERDVSRKVIVSGGLHASLANAWANDPSNEKQVIIEDPVRVMVDDPMIEKDFLSPPSSVAPSTSEKSGKLAGVWRIFSFLPNLWHRRGSPATPRHETHPPIIRTYIFDAALNFLTEPSDARSLAEDATSALRSLPLSRCRRDLPLRVSCTLGTLTGVEVWAARVQDDVTWIWTGVRTMNLTQGMV